MICFQLKPESSGSCLISVSILLCSCYDGRARLHRPAVSESRSQLLYLHNRHNTLKRVCAHACTFRLSLFVCVVMLVHFYVCTAVNVCVLSYNLWTNLSPEVRLIWQKIPLGMSSFIKLFILSFKKCGLLLEHTVGFRLGISCSSYIIHYSKAMVFP